MKIKLVKNLKECERFFRIKRFGETMSVSTSIQVQSVKRSFYEFTRPDARQFDYVNGEMVHTTQRIVRIASDLAHSAPRNVSIASAFVHTAHKSFSSNLNTSVLKRSYLPQPRIRAGHRG